LGRRAACSARKSGSQAIPAPPSSIVLTTAGSGTTGPGSSAIKAVMLAYQLYMLNGQTALSDPQNHCCPGVDLEAFPEFVSRTLSS
jgi:hypothetical protein